MISNAKVEKGVFANSIDSDIRRYLVLLQKAIISRLSVACELKAPTRAFNIRRRSRRADRFNARIMLISVAQTDPLPPACAVTVSNI
ncbi:hypothetical protein EVAR_10628_1 [Eumeta japonica]|uniref:Uncharacterized protein n=1 Tax=Eumeta variegata TaxID=151549 RepID=A0A4C1U1X3_EUMVA|nr:hypothetical protein EVAR_10628_1 [Eumeta japonica]